ncbi:MAG: glycosyltransferase 87 family protein [Sciscionella sp.]
MRARWVDCAVVVERGRALAEKLLASVGVRRAIVPLGLVLGALALVLDFRLSHNNQIDLRVYRAGVSAWLHGSSPYGALPSVLPGVPPLPFVYPPFAVLALAPLAVLGMPAAALLMGAISLLVLALVVWRGCVALRWPGLSVWLVLPLAVLLFPVRDTLSWGQVNILVMGLAALDCMRGRGRGSGVGIGIAAAIKLTPGILLVYFLLRRDWRSSGRAVGTFAATVALGFLVMPGYAAHFWRYNVINSNGPAPSYYSNEALLGPLSRLGAPGWVWVVAVLATMVIALRLANVYLHEDRAMLAIAVLGLSGLLVSPISWAHHWVWCVPILLAMFGEQAWCYRWLGVLAAVVFSTDFGLVDGSYTALALVLLLTWTVHEHRRRGRRMAECFDVAPDAGPAALPGGDSAKNAAIQAGQRV